MWSFLFLAGYVGRISRPVDGNDFDSLVRANRAREEDRRRGPMNTRRGGGSSSRAAGLRIVRFMAQRDGSDPA